jgi:hypothetical protein
LLSVGVRLNQSSQQIEQLRNELNKQAARSERNRRLPAKASPVMEAASARHQITVRFATAELSLADFQREIDDLLARRARDTQELVIKRDALSRLRNRQRQAEQALADSPRALEAAEREVAIWKSRCEHAEIESRTIALVSAIADSLKAPRESVGESLGRLRDEAAKREARNAAEQVINPTGSSAAANTIASEYERIEALRPRCRNVSQTLRPSLQTN